MRILPAATLILLLSFPLFAQKAQPVAGATPKKTASTDAKEKAAQKPEEIDYEKYGRKLLEIAEADASVIEGGTKAYVLMQIARGYTKTDKAKAVELLENALASTRVMDDHKSLGTSDRARLQEAILKALVPLAPERADDLLLQVDTEAQRAVLMSLLDYYEKKKQLDRAIEVVQRIAQDQEAPYDAVGRIMEALPKEKSGEAMQLFATSLGSYKNHEHNGTNGFVFGGGAHTFPDLIVYNWQHLPPTLVLEAIDEVLKQAKPKEDQDQKSFAPTITTSNGSASFSSMYDYVLFQMLPVVKQLDEPKAEQLIRDHQQLKALLTKYPEGSKSLFEDPAAANSEGEKGKNKSGGAMRVRVSLTGGGGGQDSRIQKMMEEMNRVSQIANDSAEHPQDALTQAATLNDPNIRAMALEGIARENVKKNTTVARSALRELTDLAPRLEGFQQARTMNKVGSLYVQMGDADSAKSAVEKAFAGVEKIYKDDTNADDPNMALKVYWPSTQAYAVLLRSAGQISAPWALTLLKEIPDAEIKNVAEVSLASQWLKLSGGSVSVMRQTKSGSNMMMQFNE